MKSAILAAVAAISLMCSLPASAAIVQYTITFNDPDGTGPQTGQRLRYSDAEENCYGQPQSGCTDAGREPYSDCQRTFIQHRQFELFSMAHQSRKRDFLQFGSFVGGEFFGAGHASTSTSTEADITTFNNHGSLLLLRMGLTQLGPARK